MTKILSCAELVELDRMLDQSLEYIAYAIYMAQGDAEKQLQTAYRIVWDQRDLMREAVEAARAELALLPRTTTSPFEEVSMAWAGVWAGAWAGARARAWAGAGAWAGVWAGAWVGIGARAWAGVGIGARARADRSRRPIDRLDLAMLLDRSKEKGEVMWTDCKVGHWVLVECPSRWYAGCVVDRTEMTVRLSPVLTAHLIGDMGRFLDGNPAGSEISPMPRPLEINLVTVDTVQEYPEELFHKINKRTHN